MNIVLCGDSYFDIDDRYPNLHWRDHLSPYNVYTLARGGASNFSIYHQVQHSTYFNPDLVLISFTSVGRIEFGKNRYQQPDMSADSLIDRQWAYRNTMYANVDHANAGYNKEQYVNWLPYYIDEFEQDKNSLYIQASLDFLNKHNIPYRFSLGGFTGNLALADTLPNSWHHPEKLSDPWFHIKDPVWHENFAKAVLNGI
jgi:hypothetical protein